MSRALAQLLLDATIGESKRGLLFALWDALAARFKPLTGFAAALADLQSELETQARTEALAEGSAEQVLGQVRSIFERRNIVRQVFADCFPDTERMADTLLQQAADPYLEPALKSVCHWYLTNLFEAMLDDREIFSGLQPLILGQIAISSRAPSPTAASLDVSELIALREALTGAQRRQLDAIRGQIGRGQRQLALQQLTELRLAPGNHWTSPERQFQAEVLRLLASLYVDLDLEEARKLAAEAKRLVPEPTLNRRLEVVLQLRAGELATAQALLAKATDPSERQLKAEVLLAQGQLNEAEECLTGLAATSETHRLMALIHLHRRRMSQAKIEIASAEGLAPESHSVKLAKAILLFYSALSPVVVPTRPLSRPQPVPFEFRLGTSEARQNLEEAARLLASLTPWGKNEAADFRCWRVACALLADDEEQARSILDDGLKLDPADESLIQWALASSLDYDLGPALDALDVRVRTQQPPEPATVFALVALLQARSRWERVEEVLGSCREHFSTGSLRIAWITWTCQSLIAQDRLDEALQICPEEPGEDELIYLRALLLIQAAVQHRVRPEIALDYLMAAHQKTEDAMYLFEACRLQATRQEWGWIASNAEKVVDEVATDAAFGICLHAARALQNPELCLSLLNRRPSAPSSWYLEARLYALTGLGRWAEAHRVAEECWATQPGPRTFRLLAVLYAELGRSDDLAALARRAGPWPQLGADFWLWLSQQILSQSPQQAREYWRRAVSDDLEDHLVTLAFFLASRLGLSDDPAAVQLFRRFETLAQEPKFGIRSANLDDLKNYLSQRREVANEAERDYLRGAPVHFLCSLGLSLAWLYHELLSGNESDPHPDQQSPVLIRSGLRPLRDEVVAAGARLHLDISSLLLAHHLGMLERVCAHFGTLWIPPSLVPALEKAREELDPGQPELAKAMEDACQAMDAGWLKVEGRPPDAGEWQLEFPSTPPSESTITGSTLFASMGARLSEDELAQARQILGSCWGAEPGPGPQPGDQIWMSWVWARLLAQTGLLRRISGHFHLALTLQDAEVLRQSRRDRESARQLQLWLAALIELLNRGLTDGRFALIPVAKEAGEVGPELDGLLELLRFESQDSSDVLWIDDRFGSMYPRREDGRRVVGILEIFQTLRAAGQLSDEEYFRVVLRMRRANLRYLPLDEEELCYWMSRGNFGQNPPSAELAQIQRALAASLRRGETLIPPDEQGQPQEWRFLINCGDAMSRTLIRCFEREVGQDFKTADWLLQYIYVDLTALRRLAGAESDEREVSRSALNLAALYWNGLLTYRGTHQEDELRRFRLFQWLNHRIFGLRCADASFLALLAKEMVQNFGLLAHGVSVRDHLLVKSAVRQMISELPSQLQDEICGDQDFVEEFGIRFASRVTVEGLTFEEDNFFTEIARALKKGKAALLTIDGRETLVELIDRKKPAFKLTAGEHSELLEDPTAAMLEEDIEPVRESLTNHPEWFDGPPEGHARFCRQIAEIAAPFERLRRLRQYLQDSPAHRYAELQRQVDQRRNLTRAHLLPAPAQRMMQRYGLELHPKGSFSVALAAAGQQFAGLDFISALEKVWAFPVELPPALMARFLTMEPAERRQVARQLIEGARSPVAWVHVLQLLKRAPEAALSRLGAQLALRFLSLDSLDVIKPFLQIASWTVRHLQAKELSGTTLLAVGWAHAHELYHALVDSGASPTKLGPLFADLLEHEPQPQFPAADDWREDVANPLDLYPRRFLAMALALLYGDSSAGPSSILARKMEELLSVEDGPFEVVQGALGSNVLDSWLAPGQEALLTTSLGAKLGELLSREALDRWIDENLVLLKENRGDARPWSVLAAIFCGRRCPDRPLQEMKDISVILPSDTLLQDTETTSSVTRLLCMTSCLGLTDEDSKARFVDLIVDAVDHLDKVHESKQLAHLLYTACYQLFRRDGERGVQGFCQALERIAGRKSHLAPRWIPGVCSLAWEVSPAAAWPAWRTLTFLRAR